MYLSAGSELHRDVPGTPDGGAQVADGDAVAHAVDVRALFADRRRDEADTVDNGVALLLEFAVRGLDGYCIIKTPDGEFRQECDAVVNGIGFVPAPVGEKGAHIHRVGDCVAIGNLRTVVWRAWDVCMRI